MDKDNSKDEIIEIKPIEDDGKKSSIYISREELDNKLGMNQKREKKLKIIASAFICAITMSALAMTYGAMNTILENRSQTPEKTSQLQQESQSNKVTVTVDESDYARTDIIIDNHLLKDLKEGDSIYIFSPEDTTVPIMNKAKVINVLKDDKTDQLTVRVNITAGELSAYEKIEDKESLIITREPLMSLNAFEGAPEDVKKS